MNIYIAAKLEMWPVLRGILLVIPPQHTVVSSWINRPKRGTNNAFEEARVDWEDLGQADLLIIDTTYPGGSGREVEFGITLARGRPVWRVGPAPNVFHRGPFNFRIFEDWKQIIEKLRGEA